MTIALGLGAAALFAASDLSGTRATRLIGPTLAMLLILLIGMLPAAVVVVATGGLPTADADRAGLLAALLAGIAYYGGQVALMRGVQHGNLAVVGPVATLEGAVATVIAFGLGERIGPVIALGIAVAVGGAVMTALEPGGRSADGVVWGLTSALLFGVASVLWAHTGELATGGVVALSRLGGLLLIVPLVARGARRPTLRRPLVRIAGSAALLEVGAIATASAALTMGPVGVASVCQSQYGTASALLALVLLDERLGRAQLAGVAITGLGVALMAFG